MEMELNEEKMKRPFYEKYAWVYDKIITRDITGECNFLEESFGDQKVLLDAGCGTGNYSIELAKRDFSVTALDASESLLEVAKIKADKEKVKIGFIHGNLLNLPKEKKFDAVLCRGVLNDITDISERKKVFNEFAEVLLTGGMIILDVREWNESVKLKKESPLFEKKVEIDGELLEFRATTRLDEGNHLLLVKEEHRYKGNIDTYNFVMKCWTKGELLTVMNCSGFSNIEFFGEYNKSTQVGSTDKVVVVGFKKEV